MAIPKFLESQFHAGADGQAPVLTAAGFPYVADLPQQAPDALVNTYRELYWRIVDEVEREFPGEARRRAHRITAGLADTHRALALLSVPREAEPPDAGVRPAAPAHVPTDTSP